MTSSTRRCRWVSPSPASPRSGNSRTAAPVASRSCPPRRGCAGRSPCCRRTSGRRPPCVLLVRLPGQRFPVRPGPAEPAGDRSRSQGHGNGSHPCCSNTCSKRSGVGGGYCRTHAVDIAQTFDSNRRSTAPGWCRSSARSAGRRPDRHRRPRSVPDGQHPAQRPRASGSAAGRQPWAAAGGPARSARRRPGPARRPARTGRRAGRGAPRARSAARPRPRSARSPRRRGRPATTCRPRSG